MEIIMSLTAFVTNIIGVIYFILARQEYYRKKYKKIIFDSLNDMHQKCSYAITQEVVHERGDGKKLSQFVEFYKDICKTMKDYRNNKIDIKEYKKIKLDFYQFYTNCGLPNF